MPKSISLSTFPARLREATTRRKALNLANRALAEGEASMRYAQHCDLADAVLAVGEAAKYGEFAVQAIAKAAR